MFCQSAPLFTYIILDQFPDHYIVLNIQSIISLWDMYSTLAILTNTCGSGP